jgi:hypothetical protein
LSEEVHRDVSLSGPEKDDILALPDIGIISSVDPDLWILFRIRIETRFDGVTGSVLGSGSGSRKAKITHKHRKKLITFIL